MSDFFVLPGVDSFFYAFCIRIKITVIAFEMLLNPKLGHISHTNPFRKTRRRKTLPIRFFVFWVYGVFFLANFMQVLGDL